MGIKNLRIRNLIDDFKHNDNVEGWLIGGCALGLVAVVPFLYYNYDVQEQVVDNSMNYFDNTVDEDGKIYHVFLPGEHRIMRKRNDSFSYEATAPDGYMIESVTVFGSLHRNQVVYVNTVPVIVQGEEQKDGTITFDEFGEVVVKDQAKSLG
ncbi:MAG: hypothetical protein K2I72_03940, partial [Bacilli bacterium]|nr:hypothetical protein [Bacilli bacterium]